MPSRTHRASVSSALMLLLPKLYGAFIAIWTPLTFESGFVAWSDGGLESPRPDESRQESRREPASSRHAGSLPWSARPSYLNAVLVRPFRSQMTWPARIVSSHSNFSVAGTRTFVPSANPNCPLPDAEHSHVRFPADVQVPERRDG